MVTESSGLAPGSWPIGAEVIAGLVADGKLDVGVVVPSVDIETMFDDAELHLKSAELLKSSDPKLAYSGMYDGVRKALTAALEKQGLRVRGGDGSHYVVYQAIRAQVGPSASRLIDPFNRMRRKRHEVQYDSASRVVEDDLIEDLPKATRIVRNIRTFSARLGPWQPPPDGLRLP